MTWEFSAAGAVASVAGGITLASVLEYLQLSGEVYAIFAGLLFLDFVFWIADAYFEDRQSVTSSNAWRWIFKKISKLILPLVFIFVLKGVGAEDISMLVTSVMSILIVTEGYSIIWHIYSINTGSHLSEIDAFSLLIEFIANLFKQKLPKKEENLETIKKDEQTTQDNH